MSFHRLCVLWVIVIFLVCLLLQLFDIVAIVENYFDFLGLVFPPFHYFVRFYPLPFKFFAFLYLDCTLVYFHCFTHDQNMFVWLVTHHLPLFCKLLLFARLIVIAVCKADHAIVDKVAVP